MHNKGYGDAEWLEDMHPQQQSTYLGTVRTTENCWYLGAYLALLNTPLKSRRVRGAIDLD
jgi:hypothetical protein